MKLEINVADEISPAIQYALENNKDFIRKATKAVGYWVQKETKSALNKDTWLTSTYKERTDYDNVRHKFSETAPKFAWYGRMKRAIGYEYVNSGVNIGWTSATAAFYARVQEFGTTRRVTRATHALYRKVGVKLGNKPTITVPARPVFEPVSAVLIPKIHTVVEEKVLHYLENGTNFGKKKRRKYKVYT